MANNKKNSNSYHGKRNNKRGGNKWNKDKRDDRRNRDAESNTKMDRTSDMDATNDVSWYSRNPELLIAAGQFPYPYRPGMSLNLTPLSKPDGGIPTPLSWRIPGFMALRWVPSMGVSSQATDPASVIGKQIYKKVRDAYSGSLEADAPDYMMYLMALDGIYSYIASLKRIYRILNAYTSANYLIPDGLLNALRITNADIQNLRSNKTLLWQYINTLILQSRKFTCPAIMDVFNRHYWMSDNVYTDADSANSQMYVFVPQAFFRFKMQPLADGSGNDGPGLEYFDPYSFKAAVSMYGKVSDLYEAGISMIDALVSWDEAYTINGYLTRAYSDAPSFTIDELPMDQVFAPVYDPEVLSQIENSYAAIPVASWTPYMAGTYVTQDPLTNAVVSTNRFQLSGPGDTVPTIWNTGLHTMPPMITVRSDNPTVADTTVATRLRPNVDLIRMGTTEQNFEWYADAYSGTEVPLQWSIWYYNSQDAYVGINVYPITGGQQSVTISDIRPYIIMSQFDWHPMMWLATYDSSTASAIFPLGDIHNCTVVSIDTLSNLHRVCLFSEFNAFG